MFNLIPLPWKILGIVVIFGAIFGGIYLKARHDGAESIRRQYAAQQLRDERRIHQLENNIATTSQRVVTQYVDRVNTVTRREYVYRDAAINQVPSTNQLTNGWVYVHDLAASMRNNTGSPNSDNADATRASDATPSGVADNQGLAVVVGNYAVCARNAEQLASLQQWIRDTHQQVEESNRNRGRNR